MKAARDIVYIDPGNTLEKTSGGIYIPESYQLPLNVGRVISAGVSNQYSMIFEEGDYVAYHLGGPESLNGQDKWITEIDGRVVLGMYPHFIQFKFKDKEMGLNLFKKPERHDDFIIDYTKDVEMFGMKVAIRLMMEDDVTESGLLLPIMPMSKKMSGTVIPGVIQAMGPEANKKFYSGGLKVGDMVLVNKRPSGGFLPFVDKKVPIWRCNATEVICKWEEDTWKPMGGRFMARPTRPELEEIETEMPHPTVKGATHTIKVHRFRGTNIVIPDSKIRDYAPICGIVHSVGGGWSDKHEPARMGGYDGPVDLKQGDAVLWQNITNQNGELQFGCEKMLLKNKDGEEIEYYLMLIEMLEAKLQGEKVSTLRDRALEVDISFSNL